MKLLHDVLEAHGYATIATKEGATALPLARQNRPDLIPMDLQHAGIAGILVAVAIAGPGGVGAISQQIYPSDPALRRALDQCSLENRGFDRLDPAAREACYRRNPVHHQSAAAAGPEPRITAAPNF